MLTTEHIHTRSYRWIAPMLVLLALAGLGFWLWSAWGQATAGSNAAAMPAASAITQTSDGGQVTVEATWQGPDAGPIFTIVLNTHSVDLDGYDLRQLAVLRTDQGLEVSPTQWDAPAGGHHRSGTLTFPTTTADGTPVLGANTRTLELIIRDVAGVPERSFRWTR